MKAIVLCAGYATRLYPLTKDKPKPLLEVDGLSILDHIACRVALMDIDELCVVTNAKFYPHFCEWAKQAGYAKPKITVVNDLTDTDETRRGSMGDVHYALQQTGWKDSFVLINGDNLCTFSFKPAYNRFARVGHTILTYDVGSLELAKLYGVPFVDSDGKVTRFVEKPKEPQSSLVSIGVYFYDNETPALLDEYVRTAPSLDKTGEFVAWLAAKRKVYTHPVKNTDGIWFDIGTLDQLEEARGTISKLHRGEHPFPSDVEKVIRSAVSQALAKIQGSPVAPDLSRRLQSARTYLNIIQVLAHPDATHRASAATILGKLCIAAAIPWLLDCIDDSRAAGPFTTVSESVLSALVALRYAPDALSALSMAKTQGYVQDS